jgi:hypothetical protein
MRACVAQAACTQDCLNTSVTPLPEYNSSDYEETFYQSRLDDICARARARARRPFVSRRLLSASFALSLTHARAPFRRPGCLEYGTPYLPASGFALFSRATKGRTDLVDAILSYEVLNAATPVLIAIISFGWLIWALERHANPQQFNAQHSGVCACARARVQCIVRAGRAGMRQPHIDHRCRPVMLR